MYEKLSNPLAEISLVTVDIYWEYLGRYKAQYKLSGTLKTQNDTSSKVVTFLH